MAKPINENNYNIFINLSWVDIHVRNIFLTNSSDNKDRTYIIFNIIRFNIFQKGNKYRKK